MGCGCISSAGDSKIRTPLDRQLSIKKLRAYVELQINKARQNAQNMQTKLVDDLFKNKAQRVKLGEQVQGQQIVTLLNKMTIYGIVRDKLDKIVQYSHLLEDPQKAKTILYPSFKVILFSESILSDQQISQFCSWVHKKYSGIAEASVQEIQFQEMKYYKTNQVPSDAMLNRYFLALCSKYSMSMQEINSVGHNFRFGAH